MHYGHAVILSALAVSFATTAVCQTAPQPPSDLLPGPGREVVIKVCKSCHSPSIITTKRHTSDEWQAIVEKMIGRGAVATDEEIDAIEDYLSKTYPPAGSPSPSPSR